MVALANPIDAMRLGSIGKPVNQKLARVVDENDREVKPGIVGELVFKELVPNALMKGYYKMPDETAAAMRGGWFHSGDRAFVDQEGYFYFGDRIKDCIRVRGENVSSFEVEKVINSHPKVLECAVVGVPCEELGDEDIKAYVVVKENEVVAPEEIISWCEGKMAYFMIPRYVEFRKTLPKTPTERISKFELRREGVGNAWDRVKSGFKIRK